MKLGPGRLALAGITHHTVVLTLPVLALVSLYLGAIVAVAGRQSTGGSTSTVSSTSAAVAGVIIFVAFLGVLFGILAMVQYVIGQHGFTLAEQGDDLHLRFGLFQVRNLTIPRRRVQHITIVDNPIRRALGIVALHLHSAAPIGGVEGRNGATRFEVPILRRDDLDQFLHALMGGDWHVPPLVPRPPAARRRAVTRRVMVLALVLLPPSLVWLPGSLGLLAFALLGIPWGLLAHRRAGHAETAEIVVLSHGVLRHHVDLLPISRVQSCTSEQNPMQRSSKIGTLHVNVAGPSRDPHLYDMADADVTRYLTELPRQSRPR